jgi:hypothetical protein
MSNHGLEMAKEIQSDTIITYSFFLLVSCECSTLWWTSLFFGGLVYFCQWPLSVLENILVYAFVHI